MTVRKVREKMTKNEFISSVAGYVQKYAAAYGILVHSPVIAQAVLESGWGGSKLSSQYHNYFGLKCGSRWTGKSVNMKTQEEYTPGTLTTISDNSRVYDSMEEGIKGYFEFIQLPRYRNLKGITDPEKYLETIRADGYATSSSYVENCMKLIRQYGLTKYDEGEKKTMGKTAESVLNVMRGWLGFNESNGRFKEIIDLYNSTKPLPRGYAVKYSDEWCDTCVSAAAVKAGCEELIGRECGVEKHIEIFKQKGIWIEDGTITPKPGYVIAYNWDRSTQPNDGYADHIGYVESVSGSNITVIEGNKGEAVARRVIPVGWGYIRGYAAPKYDAATVTPVPSTAEKSVEDVAKEVLAGKWGNGEERKNRLKAAGYDYAVVQTKVNQIAKGTANQKSIDAVAREVIRGKWGNGADRKKRITSAGYDYSAVQKRVNELLK